ncbi:FadR/GntR family transcriptional regulator [Nonomuraea cavernae]|uniref:FadR/GntR family transcriptional regulator n=1 Tax=Nonomuraea cavernae TaxID=2045107 RepID=UPI0033CA118D
MSKLRPAYQQVADQLRTLILDGSLAPGNRLPNEVNLATNFGTSRTTVREALRALTSQGLIYTLRGTTGGTFVSRVQIDQVSDYLETSIGLMSDEDGVTAHALFEARQLLEVPSAGLTAERRTDAHLKALGEVIELGSRKVSQARGTPEHRTFHEIVVDATDNALLRLMTEPIFRVLRTRMPRVMPADFYVGVDEDHEEIFALVEARDVEGASDAMRRHLEHLRQAYM